MTDEHRPRRHRPAERLFPQPDQPGQQRAEHHPAADRQRRQVATTYAGFGNQTQVLQATISANARNNAYHHRHHAGHHPGRSAGHPAHQPVEPGARSCSTAVSTAVANNDPSTLMTQVQSIFDQATVDPEFQGRQRRLYLWRRQDRHAAGDGDLAVAAGGAVVGVERLRQWQRSRNRCRWPTARPSPMA